MPHSSRQKPKHAFNLFALENGTCRVKARFYGPISVHLLERSKKSFAKFHASQKYSWTPSKNCKTPSKYTKFLSTERGHLLNCSDAGAVQDPKSRIYTGSFYVW